MTRKEIEKALDDHDPTGDMLTDDEVIDFALAMVRKHNEELEKKFDLGRVISSTWVQAVIREAKP